MDSMIGYKNDKYLDFGRCAAKLDDVLNYLPSRISAWLMILSCSLLERTIAQKKRKEFICGIGENMQVPIRRRQKLPVRGH